MTGIAAFGRRARRVALCAAALCLALGTSAVPPAAAIGRFDIKPVAVTLSASESAASIEITNDGFAPAELEIAVRSWSHSDGSDEGEATDDIVASPSIFTVDPGRTQLIRLGPTRPLGGDVERTYRLVATEVPTAPAADAGGVQTIMRMRLPIFIAPEKPAAIPLEWRAVRDDASHLMLIASNTGNVHRRIRSLRVEVAGRIIFDNVVAAYVLAHQTRRWVLPAQTGAAAQTVRLATVDMDGSTHEATLTLP